MKYREVKANKKFLAFRDSLLALCCILCALVSSGVGGGYIGNALGDGKSSAIVLGSVTGNFIVLVAIGVCSMIYKCCEGITKSQNKEMEEALLKLDNYLPLSP